MAALLTIIVTLIIIYILTGQSKLKANIALQCVKAVESAALNQQNQNCEFGLIKFLMILNLILVILLALV